jgi:hypothetical protein
MPKAQEAFFPVANSLSTLFEEQRMTEVSETEVAARWDDNADQ